MFLCLTFFGCMHVLGRASIMICVIKWMCGRTGCLTCSRFGLCTEVVMRFEEEPFGHMQNTPLNTHIR